MAAGIPDQDINKWLDALGFEKSICRMRQAKVLAHERVKNAFVDPKVSVIHTGSSAEGFCGEYYSKLSRSDFDVMVSFNKLLYIVDEDKSRADVDTNIPFVARVCQDDVHPGYTKLEPIIEEEVALTSGLVVKVDNRLFVSSSAALTTLNMPSHRQIVGHRHREEEVDKVQFERHGPASSVTVESKEEGYAKRDVVCGFRCQFWPKCAQKWITRKRKWPTWASVKEASELGCHLVPTGFPGSKTEELEWRYSFVKAERNVMWLFNDCQRKCFALLKILNKEMIACHFDAETLTSYHFKTTLLWVLEETDESDWSERTLLNCVKACLSKLMTFMKSRHCPHYFIEHANLFDRDIFNEETCEKLSNILDSVLEDPFTAIRNCSTFHTFNSDVTVKDFDFLHRCHMGFQWFMMCYRQLDELVSILGDRYWRVMMNHYKTNKTMAFNIRVFNELQAMADNPIHELFSRPFVRVNHIFLGILNHIDVTKMNPIDEEDFEIQHLYIDDAREHFVKGATGNEVIAKLRLANFEFMMKEYNQVEEILHEIVFENTLFGRDKEFARKMSKLEKLFLETISDAFDRRSVAEQTKDIERNFFIGRAYRYGLSHGVFENLEGHVQPLIDIEKTS